TATVVLEVADTAMQVQTITRPYVYAEQFPPHLSDNSYRFSRQAPASAGYAITDVRVQSPSGQGPRLGGQAEISIDPAVTGATNVRDLRLQLAPDRHSARLSGELFRDAGKRGTAPALTLPVVLVQERRVPVQRPAVPVAATLSIPG